MISITGLLHAVLILIVYCGLPEPINKVAKILVAVVVVLILIALMLSLVGGQAVFRA